MSDHSPIEWTDATWSPLRVRVREDAGAIARDNGYTSLVKIAAKMQGKVGHHCEMVSAECLRCYAARDNHRCGPGNGTSLPFDRRSRDLIDPFVDENILLQPLKWKDPRRIFVQNQTDLFGEWYTDEMIDTVFTVMHRAERHSFQVLTKRHDRLAHWASRSVMGVRLQTAWSKITKTGWGNGPERPWPLPNVWLGVSVGERHALPRIATLRDTPAAVRFVSFEPLLEDLGPLDLRGIDWAIVGGESGPGARPMHPDWARSIRDQCLKAGVKFFFKQWGEWLPDSQNPAITGPSGDSQAIRVGKKRAGRLLDGVEWNEMPEHRR